MGQGRREGHAERDAALDLLPKVQSFDTSAYLFGWGVPTFDAMYTLQNLIRTKGEGADGMYNLGNYSNKELDAVIDSIKTQTDAAKRDADIIKVLEGHAKDFGHIPCMTRSFPGPCARTSPSSIAPTTVWSPIGSRSTDSGQPAGGALRRAACLPRLCSLSYSAACCRLWR